MRMAHRLSSSLAALLLCSVLAAGGAQAADGYFWFTQRPQYVVPPGPPLEHLALGVRYDRGKGVPQNSGVAAAYYFSAAARGVPEAQYNIGRMYLEGKTVARDFVLAHMWFNLAVAAYPRGATEKRRQAILVRAVVEKKMTVEQVSEAQKLALEWRPLY